VFPIIAHGDVRPPRCDLPAEVRLDDGLAFAQNVLGLGSIRRPSGDLVGQHDLACALPVTAEFDDGRLQLIVFGAAVAKDTDADVDDGQRSGSVADEHAVTDIQITEVRDSHRAVEFGTVFIARVRACVAFGHRVERIVGRCCRTGQHFSASPMLTYVYRVRRLIVCVTNSIFPLRQAACSTIVLWLG